MSEKIKSWSKINSRDLENTMALNFCFNVDSSRLETSDVLLELSKNLKAKGFSAKHFGVGNFGFKMTEPFNPVATDGDYEGQWNDPSNDFDVVTVTNANHLSFKEATNEAVETVCWNYSNKKSKKYFHWAKLNKPEWKGSTFGIPEYCSVSYTRCGDEKNVQMEIHWEPNEDNWHKKLFSKYAPWYSTKIGFPIVNVTNLKTSELSICLWQPFAKQINHQKKHEVKVANPENFGSNTRDTMQALRIVFGSIQASIAAKELAYLSNDTLNILKNGVLKASKDMSKEQRQKALKRLATLVYRAEKLEKELPHFCFVEDCKNPFDGQGSIKEIIINNLDEIDWGVNVLGQPLKQVAI